MTPIRVELFGGLRIFHGEQPISSVNTNRLQSLLAYLVLRSDSPQSRELWQRRIIDGQAADAYDFTHDLLREVTYAELSPVRRQRSSGGSL